MEDSNTTREPGRSLRLSTSGTRLMELGGIGHGSELTRVGRMAGGDLSNAPARSFSWRSFREDLSKLFKELNAVPYADELSTRPLRNRWARLRSFGWDGFARSNGKSPTRLSGLSTLSSAEREGRHGCTRLRSIVQPFLPCVTVESNRRVAAFGAGPGFARLH